MKDSKLRECDKCGWVHFGVSEPYIQQWEVDWKKNMEELDENSLSHFGLKKGDPAPSRATYLSCFSCGNTDIDSFKDTQDGPNGSTIQPVLDRRMK